MFRTFRTIALAILSPLIVGCTAMQGGARLEDSTPDNGGAQDAVFAGVLLGQSQPHHNITRYVFNIHGMGATEDNYNDVMARWLTRAFGYRRDESSADGAIDDWVHVGLERTHRVRGEGIVCVGDRPPLPLQASQVSPSDVPASAIDCTYDTFGRYKVERFVRQLPSGLTERLVVYTYYWNEDLWRIQGPYMDEDISRPRAVINGFLKRTVVDEGFSDAAAYLGTMRPIVIDGVRGALCAMLTEVASGHPVSTQDLAFWRDHRWIKEQRMANSGPQGAACLAAIDLNHIDANTEFNFVSHSLGSRMLLDALAPYAVNGDATDSALVLQSVAQHTYTFFMAANQIPLFGIGSVNIETDPHAVRAPEGRHAPAGRGVATARVSSSGSTDSGGCSGPTFFDCVDSAPPLGTNAAEIHFAVIAFLDPDDVLGFKANSGMLGIEPQGSIPGHDFSRVRFHTVVNRNTNQWLWLLAWPTSAHDREMQNRSSVDLIFCGARAQGTRLVARTSRTMFGCEVEGAPG